MSKTYRNRQRIIGYYRNEEHLMQRVWYNYFDAIHEPIFDAGDWERYGRDKTYDYGRKRRYREGTNDIIRNKNRTDLYRVFTNPESYDDMTFATKKDGKTLGWHIW